MTRLSVDAVSVFRGDRLVLDRIGFAIPAGGALLLLGPNGAGKSTLLRTIAGLIRPAAGHISFDGSSDFAGRAGYLAHQDAIKPALTAAENLRFTATLSGGSIAAALERFGLRKLADLPARMLSAGQKRRLALARLTLTGAPLWLLDEPSVGLDTASVDAFGTVLAAHRTAGGVVVAATHVALPMPHAAELRLGEHAAELRLGDHAAEPRPGEQVAEPRSA